MFLMRHGQSHFNLLFEKNHVDPGIADPELTPLGRRQARAAAASLADVRLTRVIVSPYTRALQTAAPILAAYPVQVEIMHEVRERAAYSCDIGSPPQVLGARFPEHDFTHLPSPWWHEGIEPREQTMARADAFRARMAERGDAHTTLLVSHWAFILALAGTSLENGEVVPYDPAGAAPVDIAWM